MNHFWKKFIRGLRTNILIGLLLLMPLAGTLWILDLVITFVSNNVLPGAWLASKYAPVFRIAAVVMTVAVLYFVGLLTRNFAGRKIFQLADFVLARIPVISSVYTSIRQISESLVNTQSTLFKEVVAVQFPRPGIYSIGFVTAQVPDLIACKLKVSSGSGEEWISVFVPTTPNPTTGFFLMLPKSGLIYLNISVAGAMKMLISAGAASPWKNDGLPQQTLLDYIEVWLKRGESADQPDAKPPQNAAAPDKK
ncbi:MAG: DUF502 domain-containing protein [Kiritimatiellia bacterium]